MTDIAALLKERILVLDGAMGSMIQNIGLSEEDFHFDGVPCGIELKGDNECLNLSRPDVIKRIHQSYITAGADIIETNSFGANRISQNGFGLADMAAEMALRAARIAREAADGADRRILVAGSVGPTGKSLTMASDMDNPAYREYDFDAMTEVLREQIDSLIRGGVDFILLETCFDALTAKAAICALQQLCNPVPLVISATVSDRSGRTLTGQTLESFYHSVCHAPTLAAFGINCALGAREMVPLVKDIARFSHHPLIFYPNAGLPDEQGRYTEMPDVIAEVMRSLAADGLLNIAGGCCGTTPEHIAAVKAATEGFAPRIPEAGDRTLTVCGLDTYRVDRSTGFTNIGERTNVAGSRKFARLIAEGSYDEAMSIAAGQIAGGANIIDVNMDDAMLDSVLQMRTFLRHISTDPAVAKAAVMIDSSHFETVVEGLKNVQGKAIVNSISLKDGEEEFLRRASVIKSFGAAMVVMAFDEEGQAETCSRKIGICARCYDLLVKKAGIEPSDIIFDVNVLTIGTGIAGHSRFGVDFIDAVRWIKQNLPGTLTSGGISNLSFAFRGNNTVRQAMHSVFLYHAIAAGLDMAIVNPQMLQIYDELEPTLRQRIEDVIFDRDADATARLVEHAEGISAASQSADSVQSDKKEAFSMSAEERLCHALITGDGSTLEADVMACLEQYGSAMAVIEGPLVGGMEKVGGLFADGRMFLPQIVRSAKIMKDAVAVLQPYISDRSGEGHRPKVVMATVRGDVHDIGKNIVATVLQCSGFEVIDLGVMVPAGDILTAAMERKADIIAVSGLITPSLYRMEELCRSMAELQLGIPLFVGGAAASAMHTAVRLSPLYDNVHYRADASATAVMAKKYMAAPEDFRRAESEEHRRLRSLKEECSREQGAPSGSVPATESASAQESAPASESAPAPVESSASGFLRTRVFSDIPLTEASAADYMERYDWKLFNVVCGTDAGQGNAQLRKEAEKFLSGSGVKIRYCVRFIDCVRQGDDIVSADGSGITLPMLRQSGAGGHCMADFFPDKDSGYVSQLGLFAICVDGDPDDDDMLHHAARVALAETVSSVIKADCESQAGMTCKVIMPAVGYACCPDHSLKRDILSLLDDVGIRLTESCAMIPEASICGMIIAHRDARYNDIRSISAEDAAAYIRKRNFTQEESRLFLEHLFK